MGLDLDGDGAEEGDGGSGEGGGLAGAAEVFAIAALPPIPCWPRS